MPLLKKADAMETHSKKPTDLLFIIGVTLAVIGWGLANIPLWSFIFLAIPLYSIGAFLIACSRKSVWTKLLIILIPGVLNFWALFYIFT